jgi:hypothetical protein
MSAIFILPMEKIPEDSSRKQQDDYREATGHENQAGACFVRGKRIENASDLKRKKTDSYN